MNRKAFLCILLLIFLILSFTKAQEIPYNLTPDWESTPNNHVATGLGLADINNDGWKDIIVANGNDIYRQHLVVYYNNGDGTFPLNPSWESSDIDYHGHLATGDINNDGWIDIAVSVYLGASGFSEPGKVKVYYNINGELESTPSFVSTEFYTFSCALGDADGDGDLDIVTTAGEPYGSIFDNGKIFYNNNGFFEINPQWNSTNVMGAMDVDFADMDGNGFLDVIFSCEETPNCIFLADSNGNISETPSWESAETSNYMNSLDIGFTCNKTTQSIVSTGNDQLGGDGKIRLYSFENGIPSSSYASWTSQPIGYGSGIILAEINQDEYLDMIYGGWWYPMEISLGDSTGFENIPSYTSSSSSVVEAIQIADIDRDNININLDTIIIELNDIAIIYLKKQLIENVLSVTKNGTLLNQSEYCFVPNKSWITFKDHVVLNDIIIIEYEYSNDGDIVISNWDSSKGNYIFYNTNDYSEIIEITQNNKLPALNNIYPNPAQDIINISYYLPYQNQVNIKIFDMLNNEVLIIKNEKQDKGNYSICCNISELRCGTYFIQMTSDKYYLSKKMIIIR